MKCTEDDLVNEMLISKIEDGLQEIRIDISGDDRFENVITICSEGCFRLKMDREIFHDIALKFHSQGSNTNYDLYMTAHRMINEKMKDFISWYPGYRCEEIEW